MVVYNPLQYCRISPFCRGNIPELIGVSVQSSFITTKGAGMRLVTANISATEPGSDLVPTENPSSTRYIPNVPQPVNLGIYKGAEEIRPEE